MTMTAPALYADDRPDEWEGIPDPAPIQLLETKAIETLTDEECYLAAIFEDRSGLDLAEFCWVDENAEDNCYRAYPYQWAWWRDRSDRSIDQSARSVGKALAVDTPIPTRSGWKPMGDLVEGDVLFDQDGRPTTVTEAFGVRHDRPCYRITFDNHTSIVADADHRWLTTTRADRAADRSASVRTTEEIARSVTDGGTSNHAIQIAGNLTRYNSHLRSYAVEPYTLGAWLGDGSSFRAHITAFDEDGVFITEQIRSEGYEVAPLGAEHAFSIRRPKQGTSKRLSVTNSLRHYGLIGNKHIPKEYLRAGTNQRRALLQGIMDTDGHITKAGRCEITLKSERLARDVYELVVSLRQKAYFEERRATCNGVDAGPVYRVGFHPQRLVPFRLPRKAARVRPPKRAPGQHRVVSVERVDTVPVRCIAVDSPSHTFLAGEAMIPTHNSESIMAQACVFPFVFPSAEFVIIAPEGQHADAITDRIEGRIRQSRLLSSMLTNGRSGIRHKPFVVTFANNARVYSRLPQRSGLGVKGIHPAVLHVDEAQDVSDKTWAELPEVVRWDIPGACWKVHGVSKGIQGDAFYRMSQANSGFTVHKMTALHKPSWNAKEREQKIKEYGGSSESPDYKRNVLGEHGAAMNRIFVLSRLFACIDTMEASEYNTEEYFHVDISADALMARVTATTGVDAEIEASTEVMAAALRDMCDFPAMHRAKYGEDAIFWAGADIGVISDPTEILIFVEYVPDKAERMRNRNAKVAVPDPGMSRFKLVSRIKLRAIPLPLQAQVIMHVIDYYKPRAFSMDKTGLGIGLMQDLQQLAGSSRIVINKDADDVPVTEEMREMAGNAITTIKGYGFAQKICIDIDSKIVDDEQLDDPLQILEKAGIYQVVKDRATDVLRAYVDTRRLMLPYDQDVINQMNGQTWATSQEPIDKYGRRRSTYSIGTFHILDGARMFALGESQQAIEALFADARKPTAPVIVQFGF